MQRIVLLLACLASESYGHRVAFNPSAVGARAPIASPNVATLPFRHQAPVMSKSALLDLFANNAQHSDSSNNLLATVGNNRFRWISPLFLLHRKLRRSNIDNFKYILQRLVSSAAVKRAAKITARAVGAFAAVLLLMQASAFAMPAGVKLPLAFSPASVWAGYETAVGEKPLLVKSLTSLVFWTLGDILCQTGVENRNLANLDKARTFRQALFGLAWHGPSSHYFYGYLDTLMPGATLGEVAAKVLIDKEFWNPIFVTIYFMYLNVMQGKTMADIKATMKQDIVTGMKAERSFWLAAHFVNFRFIPSDQRVLYINTVQILYINNLQTHFST